MYDGGSSGSLTSSAEDACSYSLSECEGGSEVGVSPNTSWREGLRHESEVWTDEKLLQASLDGNRDATLRLRDAVKEYDFAVYAVSWLLDNLGGGASPSNDDETKSRPAEVGIRTNCVYIEQWKRISKSSAPLTVSDDLSFWVGDTSAPSVSPIRTVLSE
jgi:hypothetical protein